MKPNRQKIPITKDWKDIEGWEGYYMVSNKGQIMSLERTQLRTMPDGTKRRMGVRRKILAQKKAAKGYKRVQLTRYGRHEYFTVHGLVAKALLGPAPCVTREASAMVLLFLLNTNYH